MLGIAKTRLFSQPIGLLPILPWGHATPAFKRFSEIAGIAVTQLVSDQLDSVVTGCQSQAGFLV